MPRSQWKTVYVDSTIQNHISNYYHQSEIVYSKLSGNIKSRTRPKPPVFKTFSRNSTITLYMVGLLIHVHNGNKFIGVKIKKDMVGRKLGEFAYTRNSVVHKKTKKK
jgi:small subunit ribosomal protein S19